MQTIGIDPGADGAIAFADRDAGVYRAELLSSVTFAWLRQHTQDPCGYHVYVEKAQAMPKNGAVSMFNYGLGFGRLLGWLDALGQPYTLVPPSIWARAMHLGCTGKDAKAKSRQAAERLFPHMNLLATERSTVPHAGIIDALLICEYGRRRQLGEYRDHQVATDGGRRRGSAPA